MTVKRYKELKEKYYCGPVFIDWGEPVKQGFYTDRGQSIPELDAEPDVQRWGRPESDDVWYCVFAPQGMKEV